MTTEASTKYAWYPPTLDSINTSCSSPNCYQPLRCNRRQRLVTKSKTRHTRIEFNKRPLFLTGRLYLTFQPALVSGSSCPCFLAALKVHSNTAISINFLVYLEMNRTLIDCGFKKTVELKNGGLYDITETLQKPVKMSTSDFKCQKCSQSFFRKQHLEMHTKYKHPEVEVDSLDKFTSALNIESVDLYV